MCVHTSDYWFEGAAKNAAMLIKDIAEFQTTRDSKTKEEIATSLEMLWGQAQAIEAFMDLAHKAAEKECK